MGYKNDGEEYNVTGFAVLPSSLVASLLKRNISADSFRQLSLIFWISHLRFVSTAYITLLSKSS